MANELSKADAIELLEALANGDIDTFDMDPVIAMLREPTYRWRPVEKETGDGPFLGWGPGWLSVQSVYRSSYVHDGKRYSFWNYSESLLSDVTGEAEGLTHVCDLHLPTDGGEDV